MSQIIAHFCVFLFHLRFTLWSLDDYRHLARPIENRGMLRRPAVNQTNKQKNTSDSYGIIFICFFFRLKQEFGLEIKFMCILFYKFAL